MFYSEHSKRPANSNDQCKHGKTLNQYGRCPSTWKRIDAKGSCFLICHFDQVLCDRHFGGINYPVGGVGEIAKSLAKGLVNKGSEIQYKANVTNIIVENGKAVSPRV